jgi:putative photosynthetic complex assembly protein
MSQHIFTAIGKTTEDSKRQPFSPIKKIHFQSMIVVMLLSLIYVTYETQFAKNNNYEIIAVKEKADLVFKDGLNGEIIVQIVSHENDTYRLIKEIQLEGEQGFLRGTLRALTRERKSRQLSHEIPFELRLDSDNHLSITDPLTKNSINLDAFGPDNVAVFTKLMIQSRKTKETTEEEKNHIENSKEMK